MAARMTGIFHSPSPRQSFLFAVEYVANIAIYENLCFSMPKNEFSSFTVSCFMNFHHPFMFDNFSPFLSHSIYICSGTVESTNGTFYKADQSSYFPNETVAAVAGSKLNANPFVVENSINRNMFQFQ